MSIQIGSAGGGTNFKLPPHTLSNSASIPVNGTITYLNITGPCIIRKMALGAATYGAWVRITIDGTVMASPYDGNQRWYGGGSTYTPPQRTELGQGSGGMVSLPDMLVAKKSLLIELIDRSGSGWTAQGMIEYSA